MSGDFGELAIDLPGARPSPIGWEQIVYVFAVGTAYELRQNVGQIGGRVDVVELARLDEARNRGPVFGAKIMACEERIFSLQGNRPHAALDRIVIDLQSAVFEKADQSRPVVESVANFLAQLC